MATQVTDATAEAETEAELVAEIRVAVPAHGLRHDLRAVSIVWRRELIRFRTDRLRAVTSLIQPFLFLFVLGTGLSSLAGHSLPSGRGLQDLHLSRRARDVGAVHLGLLGGLDRVGQGVRLPPRDARRTGQPRVARRRQVPGRHHDRHFPRSRVPGPGRVRARALQPGPDADAVRRADAAVVHPDSVRRDDGCTGSSSSSHSWR